MVTQRCSDLTHIPTLSLSHLLGHRRCRAPMDLTVLIRVFYFHSADCEYCYRNRENHFLMAFFGRGFVVIFLPCVLQIKHYILGVSYLLPIIGFLPRVSSCSQVLFRISLLLCSWSHTCLSCCYKLCQGNPDIYLIIPITSHLIITNRPISIVHGFLSHILQRFRVNSIYVAMCFQFRPVLPPLCALIIILHSQKILQGKGKKNDAQRPANRSNEFVACHKGYNHIDVAPHPQPTHQHSSDSNTELHDSQEAVAHHVVSQGLNPSTGCPSSTSNVSLHDEVFKNKRPKITQHTRFQSSQRADASIPQNETHANNNEVTDCRREQTSASGSTSRQPNDPPPLKVPTNSPSNLCIDDYFAQSNNPTRKRKKNDAQRPVTCSNEFVACHKGYNHISVAPHPQPTHQHSSDSNTELHHSHEVVAHHVVSQGLNPSTGCPSSTSNVSLQDEVFKNKRPKITQHTRFQSSQRADAGIPQNETHTNNNEVTDCRRGDQCTNVAPDPQAPQHHATTSNTEAHESHQDANNHFAAENLHSPSCSTSDFGKRVSQNKRPKRKQPASCTSTSRPTGGATHNPVHSCLAQHQSQKGQVFHLFQGLIHFFDTHNELVQMLRAARDLSDQPDVPEFKLKLYNAEGARGYELPTSNTLAAIVFDSGPMSESDFDVIIQYKGGEPQRINKLHKSYMSMQFPLIFIYGQPGFHTGLMSRPTAPNKQPRRVSLNAQMETTASTQQQTTTDDKTLAVTATSTQLAETASNEQPLQTAVPMQEVIYHLTIRTLDGVVVQSTRSEFGGKGTPIRQVMGKSKMILGLIEGLPTMLKGEVAVLKMKPELHYGEDDCPVSVPDSFPKDAELNFEIELIEFAKIKVITDDFGVMKKVIKEAQSWENPRDLYEVKARISAKSGDGQSLKLHTTGEQIVFTFGKSEVPKGLEMGIGTMSRGEKAVIYVTSQYLSQSPLIPSAGGVEEVHFEVELIHFIQVRDVLGDGRLIKRRVKDGKGEFPMDCPLQDSRLRVHYKGMLINEEKTVFYDTRVDNNGQPLEFSSGEGAVPEGFEMCVRLMLPEEISLVTCPPDYAYDKFTSFKCKNDVAIAHELTLMFSFLLYHVTRPANVPEGAYVQWEIELLGFEMEKDWTGMNFRAIMDDVEKTKGTGNRLFKEGKYALAKAKYDKILREFNHVNPQDDEEGKEFASTRSLLNLNVAACYLKMGDCRKSIETCNKVLDANPVHVKALYRRGMAYMETGDYDEARADFNKMMTIDKSSEANAKAALLKLKQTEQEVEKKARKQFKGLFDKKPGEISEVGLDDKISEINNDAQEPLVSSQEEKDIDEDAPPGPPPARMGSFSRLLTGGMNLFKSLGVNRCSIL
ncbi:FKBP-type peptidyl-prolyl cis-trans isomerase family protein [Artemisia annua]|uniref:peptidylprolyl isomerase n=1 Tax=Artemisia annua TaxID=35608 RepID=A0A2U1Q194_ARTAN|nr:FKBP-type peptidyl-prolyl cis-trans isomerase family protein [Artemisia annua]